MLDVYIQPTGKRKEATRTEPSDITRTQPSGARPSLRRTWRPWYGCTVPAPSAARPAGSWSR